MIIIYDKAHDSSRLDQHHGMKTAAHTIIEIDGDCYRFMKRSDWPGVNVMPSQWYPLDDLPEDVFETVSMWLTNIAGLNWEASR